MPAGITSQYGFLYQKYVFMNTAICHASMDLFFSYEGIDDIDVIQSDENDGNLFMISSSKNNYIQVKSGTVSKECWAKVLGNWILVDDSEDSLFTLICENDLDFDNENDEIIEYVYKYFENGNSKSRKSIAKRVNEKLFTKYDEKKIKSIIKELSTGCEMKTVTMDYITENLKQKVYDTYCTDIKIYDRAKQFRFERLLEYLLAAIDDSIKQKKKYTLTFQTLMEIVRRVQTEISDEKYVINTSEVKKRKRKDAESLVREGKIREIRQLKLVKDEIGFITNELVNELLYKEFREVYVEGGVEISNIEDIAYTNFQEVLFEFDDSYTAKELYVNTINKEIHSSIMENSPIYRHGCYIYLTGQEIESEKQISWGDENE